MQTRLKQGVRTKHRARAERAVLPPILPLADTNLAINDQKQVLGLLTEPKQNLSVGVVAGRAQGRTGQGRRQQFGLRGSGRRSIARRAAGDLAERTSLRALQCAQLGLGAGLERRRQGGAELAGMLKRAAQFEFEQARQA